METNESCANAHLLAITRIPRKRLAKIVDMPLKLPIMETENGKYPNFSFVIR